VRPISPDKLLPLVTALPIGYGEGLFEGRRWGVTIKRSADERRWWLWGEELGGPARVSANIYVLSDGRTLLKPCEMPRDVVERFLLEYTPKVRSRPSC
jgi:hypothetical protein